MENIRTRNTIRYNESETQIVISLINNKYYNEIKNILKDLPDYCKASLNFEMVVTEGVSIEENKLLQIIEKWYCGELTETEKTKPYYKELKSLHLIPSQYIHQRAGSNFGTKKEFHKTINNLIIKQILRPISKEKRNELKKLYEWKTFGIECFYYKESEYNFRKRLSMKQIS